MLTSAFKSFDVIPYFCVHLSVYRLALFPALCLNAVLLLTLLFIYLLL